ncbi:MAG: NAD(+) synthase [Candidatus Gastranaerophilales bacterium]|nr:NAD(+) synthase [Candidatus Gastranaerophilales bacterium]
MDLNYNNIVMAQLNPLPGCVEKNAQKVMQSIKNAQKINSDLIIFPELTLMGYPIMDTIDRHPVIVEENVNWLKKIAEITDKTHAIVGFVEPRNGQIVGKRYYNAVAILGDGKIKGIVRKSLLPTYSEFNDYRYFEPSPVVGVQSGETLGDFGFAKIAQGEGLIDINGLKCAVVICEDGWNDKDFFSNPLYNFDPVEILAKAKPDVIINCSASPTRSKKEQLKHNLFSFTSKKYQIPIIYVNQVGAIDDISFDGSSRVYNSNGELIARGKSFEEDFIPINLETGGKIEPLTRGLEKTLTEQKVFSLDYEPDLERTYKTIIQGIRDYFGKNSLKRAVLGLSGGLDSSVCATLLTDALGAENVFGVSMPSVITSQESKDDAAQLAKNLRINFATAPIKEMVNTINEQLKPLFEKVEKDWNGNRHKNSYVQDNVQARSRANLLWGIANEFEATIPIATSDKSELYMGYATINGDMSGGFAPIADVPKTKLFALARWLNKNREVKNAIPEAIILKPPGAELAINPKTGKPLKAEEALMPYEFMDEVIWRIENKHESYQDMINSTFLYETKNNVTSDEKRAWLDKFYKRMSGALYKWSILPPSVIVEGRSINKNDYRQPITSGKIDYKGS